MFDNADMPRVLVAAEDHELRAFLVDNLMADGYAVCQASNAQQAEEALRDAPAAIVCDLNGNTLALVDRVRNAQAGDPINPDIALLLLSSRTNELDRVRSYDRGADDYLHKPFSYPELRARLRAVLRRCTGPQHTGPIRVGTLQIDASARDVTVNGHAVALTAKEFQLLSQLASDPRRVFTKTELLRDVWGYARNAPTRTLDSHAVRLRSKLQTAGADALIINVWGVGYRLTG
jgi:DNA-binding response OmpR family regulator